MALSGDDGIALWWIKRDVRLSDNEALCSAIAEHRHVVPVYLLDPELANSSDCSRMHLLAIHSALRGLAASLEKRGSRLFFAQGDTVELLSALKKSLAFSHIYSHEETGNNKSWEKDKSVAHWCNDNRVTWIEKTQTGVIRGSHDRDRKPAIIAERLFESKPLPAPKSMPPPLPVQHLAMPDKFNTILPAVDSFVAISSRMIHDPVLEMTDLDTLGEHQAMETLESFLGHRAQGYLGAISSPNSALSRGSRLSAHLAWGTISLRTVFSQTNQRLNSLEASNDGGRHRLIKDLRGFRSRLFWHDHFVQRFESATFMENMALNPAYRSLEYEDNERYLEAWMQGTTGIPLVDACMRCLRTTGFINFRMRAMLVSVACYGLGLSWKKVQYPLARVFYDYEPGIHFSQVQMQAGVVGINTIRVYNPHKQLLEQDPACRFVKTWIPELNEFSAEDIANYRTQPLGDYSSPIADVEQTGAMMKNRIFAIRNSREGLDSAKVILAKYGSRRPASGNKKSARQKTRDKAAVEQMQLNLWD